MGKLLVRHCKGWWSTCGDLFGKRRSVEREGPGEDENDYLVVLRRQLSGPASAPHSNTNNTHYITKQPHEQETTFISIVGREREFLS